MSQMEEAVQLLEKLPDDQFLLVLRLLRVMQKGDEAEVPGKRFGAGRDEIRLPEGFFEHFDDGNDEIAEMFGGES